MINKLQLKPIQIFKYMKYIILYKRNAKLALQYIKIIFSKLSIINLSQMINSISTKIIINLKTLFRTFKFYSVSYFRIRYHIISL